MSEPISAPPLVQFSDPETGQPLFRQAVDADLPDLRRRVIDRIAADVVAKLHAYPFDDRGEACRKGYECLLIVLECQAPK